MTTDKKPSKFNAVTLRALLSVTIFVIIGATIAMFTFAHQELSSYAVDISKKKADASASNDTIDALEQAEGKLEKNRSVIEKSDQLYSKDKYPEFTIVEEVQRIAKRNNISVDNFVYGSSADENGAADATTPPSTGSSGATPMPGATTGPSTAANAPTFTLTLTVEPFKKSRYKNFLQFLYDIEQNLPKMKINGVTLSSGTAESSDESGTQQTGGSKLITVSPIVLDMYVKE